MSAGPAYAGKPRPAVILQDDRFDTDSVTVCPLTTDPTDAPLFRLVVGATPTTGLSATVNTEVHTWWALLGSNQ